MGVRQQVADFAQNHFLRLSTLLREFGDLFNPSRAGISEAVVPPTSKFIGKSAADLRLRKQQGIRLLAINRDKEVHNENIRHMPPIGRASCTERYVNKVNTRGARYQENKKNISQN